MRIQIRIIIWTLIIIVVSPFIWILIFTGDDLTEVDLMEKHLAEMRDRLHYAESLNQEREQDVFNLRQQLQFIKEKQNFNLTNETFEEKELREDKLDHLLANFSFIPGLTLDTIKDLSLPNIFTYLPHLILNPDSIKPSFKLSKGKFGVSMVIGIPTIKREKETYLEMTLRSLIDNLNEEEKQDCLIVVLIAEITDKEYIKGVIQIIEENFKPALDIGLLEIIVPSPAFYPNMNDLQDMFGDSMERVRWRTKQNLDYSYLMMYAKSRGTYYIQLEDDVMTKAGYFSLMKNFVLEQKLNFWLLLEFSHLGFIGKLFKSQDLPFIVEFFLMFYRDKPVDWLLDHLLFVKVCNPEKDNKHCFRSMEALRRRYKPSLFQHIGTYSSLKGKVQKLKDKDFGKGALHKAHLNPEAEVSTSLKPHEHYTLERAYLGEIFFWGIMPQEHDSVQFKFSKPIYIEEYLFRSGNPEHTEDRFYNSTVEVLPSKNFNIYSKSSIQVTLKNDRNKINSNNQSNLFTNTSDDKNVVLEFLPITSDGYYIIGEFNKDTGIAEGTIPKELGPIEILRLFVQSSSKSWVILSEIMIKEKK